MRRVLRGRGAVRLSVPAPGYVLAWQGDFGADLPTEANSRLSTRSEFAALLDACEAPSAAHGAYAAVTPDLLRAVYDGLQQL